MNTRQKIKRGKRFIRKLSELSLQSSYIDGLRRAAKATAELGEAIERVGDRGK